MTWRALVGCGGGKGDVATSDSRSEVAVASGHVRRGKKCPAAMREFDLGLDCGIFGGDHIFIGRGS